MNDQEPGLHLTHSLACRGWTSPRLHGVQVSAPASEYVGTIGSVTLALRGHDSQLVCPISGVNVPGRHLVHIFVPSESVKRPAGHSVHNLNPKPSAK